MALAEQLERLLPDLVVAKRPGDPNNRRRSFTVGNGVNELSSHLDEHMAALLSLRCQSAPLVGVVKAAGDLERRHELGRHPAEEEQDAGAEDEGAPPAPGRRRHRARAVPYCSRLAVP